MQSTQQRRAFHIAPDQDKEKVMSDKFVPVGDVAERFSVSKHTVRAWLSQGTIPDDLYVKIGSTYRYDLKGIEQAFRKVNKSEEVKPNFDPEDMLDEDF